MRLTDRNPDRRAFLLLSAGAGTALLSACTVNNPFRAGSAPAARAVQDLSPDAATAVRAVTGIRTLQRDLEEATSAYPRLTGRLTSLKAMHQAHLAALQPAVPDGVDTAPPSSLRPTPSSAAAALAGLTAAEHRHRDALVDLAVAARSGPFARLLGSMSAAVSQQLAELAR